MKTSDDADVLDFVHPEDPGWLEMPDWPDVDTEADHISDVIDPGHCVAFLASRQAPVDRVERMHWDDLAELLTTPVIGPKDGPAWMPADIDPGPRQRERVRSLTLLALDIEAHCQGQGDAKQVIGPEPADPEAMLAELSARGWRSILHTTHSHSAEHPRYRVVLDVSRPLTPSEVRPLGEHVALLLGVHDACDLKCLEPARLLYLPRIQERSAEFRAGEVSGAALDVDALLAAARATSTIPEPSPSHTREPQEGAADVIGAFNARWSPGEIMERNGYKREGKRWLFLGSSSGIPGIVELPASAPPRVFSHHSGDPLANGHACDAFDCFVLLEHGGDYSAAVRVAADLLGLTASRQAQASRSAPRYDQDTGEVLDWNRHQGGHLAQSANGDGEKDWPEPCDLWARYEEPALPTETLPLTIDLFARRQAAIMGADPAGLAMAALTVCGAAIPDCIELQVKRNDPTWREHARLWVALVGPPSRKKTPVFKAAIAPLRTIDNQLMRSYLQQCEEHDALDKDEKKVTPKPKQRRLIMSDSTTEAAQEVLMDSPDGVLSEQDELSGWFGSMDRYNTKGGGDRAFWLKAFNGGTYNLNRIGRGAKQIPNLSISLLGGIQPEPMRKFASESVDDGLLQRMLTVILKPSSVGQDLAQDQAAVDYDRLVADLYALRNQGHRLLHFSDGARAVRDRLEREHLELAMALESVSPKLAAHYGKYDGIFARLCLIFHCIDNAYRELELEISEYTAIRVATFMAEFIRPSAIAFYAGVLGMSAGHEDLVALASIIVAKGMSEVAARDVQSAGQSLRHITADQFRLIAEKMEAFGWLERGEPKPRSNTPRWVVNPRVHSMFEDRAVREMERRAAAREALSRSLRGSE